uniref:Uncharacterized protein n=1 Tax=Plectus sambesii TaxID=2011161 RepID=A0A914V4R7_9BILA
MLTFLAIISILADTLVPSVRKRRAQEAEWLNGATLDEVYEILKDGRRRRVFVKRLHAITMRQMLQQP